MKKIKALFFISLLVLFSSCLYKMPSETAENVIPMTNNPNIIQDTPTQMPQMGGF